jgi:DNA repair exonuclease SbcCD nuclease subunit
MLKFLHAADVHLDSPLAGLERYAGAPAEEIRAATRRAFENLVALAIEEEVAFVLLAGDLYDGDWKDYNTGLFFSAQMARLEEAGIRAFLVAGNHDAASQITKVLRPPANVKVFSTKRPETEVLADLGVAIHGQGFAHAVVSEDLSAGYPAAVPHLFNIGLLHTSLDGRPGHASYAPSTVGGLRSRGYQYWALGHVHRREVVAVDPWTVFPGNLQGRHARETGAKGATLVAVDDRGAAVLEHRDLDVFRWAACSVDLTEAATAGEVLERARAVLDRELAAAAGRPLAVRLRLGGDCPIHAELAGAADRWREELRALANGFGAGALWIEQVRFETRPAADRAAAFDREDALGGLLRTVRDLEAGDADLAGLAAGFSELRTRLPAELLAGGEALDPADPERLRTLLGEVKDLLLARLLASSIAGPAAGRETAEP